ncbi:MULTISPECIES: Crp/Fnr family transcriptional regulator [Fusobacterium]|uniref:Crp/Fnr family transcriptional regulator n=1 Tax=Fusobacterium TaxID=848 RepID=UPI0025BCC5B6|nr:Crp/Fnr family transcriptional regulator [Fusobacterium sp.]MCI5724823.1 Crp/Fnr family transcriptional regulator [Fusobacterium sp.]MDY5306329.1 Crp/Fnr family transcriptional regulator [Fusobacterium gastrosuis]
MEEILKNTHVFKGLSDERIKELLSQIRYERKKYKDFSNIAYRGDEIDGLNIILKGIISTEMLTKEGNVKKIEDLKATDILASAFIFGENNRFPVDLIGNGDVEILKINRANFLKLLSLEGKILENFLNEISNKTQFLSAKIWSNFNNRTISEKISNYIVMNQKNGEVIIPNLKSLAENFGIARPSLSRVLGDYVDDGKLERIGRNKYKILNEAFFIK